MKTNKAKNKKTSVTEKTLSILEIKSVKGGATINSKIM